MFVYKEKYDLPDIDIVNTKKKFDYKIWKPNFVYVVLGKSDNEEQAVLKQKNVKASETIYLLKRPSGGHSVVLTPRTLVISAVSRDDKITVKQMFSNVNSIIIKALENIKVNNLYENGISDISIKEKKILGSSMYKHKDYLFYHAVLNISESPQYISSLLAHPTSEPEYRQKRSHTEFITSIQMENPQITINEVENSLEKEFFDFLMKNSNLNV